MNVTAITSQKIVFKGEAKSVILPGERGVFEILPFHKHLISRLVKGKVSIDGRTFPILRGIAKVEKNSVSIIVEKESPPDES
jgi:F-type H+-transporting ATPase subunit epsilon